MTNNMILNRIPPNINHILRPNQNIFRHGRATLSHILALRHLIEGVKSYNLKAIIIFVEFKNEFDGINKEIMLRILESYGILESYDIPYNIIQAIALTYNTNTQNL